MNELNAKLRSAHRLEIWLLYARVTPSTMIFDGAPIIMALLVCLDCITLPG